MTGEREVMEESRRRADNDIETLAEESKELRESSGAVQISLAQHDEDLIRRRERMTATRVESQSKLVAAIRSRFSDWWIPLVIH